MKYRIFDPTGNITALVESEVSIDLQPQVAAGIMKRHGNVEQVGFIRFHSKDKGSGGSRGTVLKPYPGINIELRMAGGEFCGNASMCAAALYLLRRQSLAETTPEAEATPEAKITPEAEAMPEAEMMPEAEDTPEAEAISDIGVAPGAEETVFLRVSGASEPVEVRLKKMKGNSFDAGIRMPGEICTEQKKLSAGEASAMLPVVRMEGITHILIESGSAFFYLKENREEAERMVKKWCKELSADGLGLMFLEKKEPAAEHSEQDSDQDRNPDRGQDPDQDRHYDQGQDHDRIRNRYTLTPLVYIPGSDTVFWESSCASGTAAAGFCLAGRAGCPSEYVFFEPAGVLRVRSDPGTNEIRLYGKVAFHPSLTYTL